MKINKPVSVFVEGPYAGYGHNQQVTNFDIEQWRVYVADEDLNVFDDAQYICSSYSEARRVGALLAKQYNLPYDYPEGKEQSNEE